MRELPTSMKTMSRIALLVAVGDLASKAVAKWLLGGSATVLNGWLSLAVVHNPAGAFGWTAGSYTWQLNLALTLCAIVFIIPVTRDLSRVDRHSPVALGLVVGGALGNLASLITSPEGVVDFIELHWTPGAALVLNFADIAAYAGVAMLARTTVLIVRALAQEVTARRSTPPLEVGDAFVAKMESKRALRRLRLEPTASYVAERAARDWSQVADLGVLADAPPTADADRVRPMGAAPRRKLRLEPVLPGDLDPAKELHFE